jgi:hypothetical protein
VSTLSPRKNAQVGQVRRALKWAEDKLELSDTEVGGALGASPRSVARWREALHQPSERHIQAAERLLELAHALDAVFGSDAERLHTWLHESLPALRGRTPLRMIINGNIDDVLTILANIDSGAFA